MGSREAKKEKKLRVQDKEKQREAAQASKAPTEKSIDEILKELEKQEKPVAPEETPCAQPSPRAYASLTAHPDKDELLLFGGEFNTGRKTLLYNDLYCFNVKKQLWKKCTYPNAPPPRSAHQAVALARDGGELYVFGGEFSSPSGAQFHHYKDLWVLHLATKTWEKIEDKANTGPSPRSGHRLVAFGRKIVLFGGCHDDMKKAPKYFNDVHVFDTDDRTWAKLKFPTTMLQPDPRSGCQLAAGPTGVVLFGGYTSVHVKGEIYRGVVHTDTWLLTEAVAPAAAGAAAAAPVTAWSWAKAKSVGAPTVRASASMATRAATAYSFGGVCDEETEDAIKGQFYDELYQLNLETLKWHLVQPKLPMSRDGALPPASALPAAVDAGRDPQSASVGAKVLAAKAAPARADVNLGPGGGGGGDDDASDNGSGSSTDSTDSSSTDSGDDDDGGAKATPGKKAAAAAAAAAVVIVPQPEATAMGPLARVNAAMTVKGTRLYMYGGTYEVGDRSMTLSDLYYMDVGKADRWHLVHENDARTQELLDDLSSDDDSSDSDDDSDGGAKAAAPKPGTKKYKQLMDAKRAKAQQQAA